MLEFMFYRYLCVSCGQHELFLHCLIDSCAIANGDHNKGDKVLK